MDNEVIIWGFRTYFICVFCWFSKKTKTLIRKDICILKFITALFTIAKKWKPHKCPLIDEEIKKCDTHTQKYCLAIKNEILSFCDLDGLFKVVGLQELQRK